VCKCGNGWLRPTGSLWWVWCCCGLANPTLPIPTIPVWQNLWCGPYPWTTLPLLCTHMHTCMHLCVIAFAATITVNIPNKHTKCMMQCAIQWCTQHSNGTRFMLFLQLLFAPHLVVPCHTLLCIFATLASLTQHHKTKTTRGHRGAIIDFTLLCEEYHTHTPPDPYYTCITTKFQGEWDIFDWAMIFSFSPLLQVSKHWGNNSTVHLLVTHNIRWYLPLCIMSWYA